MAVHGKVAYKGEPLTNASITFFPSSGRSVAASVVVGEYAIDLPPGDYGVVLTVGAELPPGWKEGDPVPQSKIALPDTYSIRGKSTLKTTVKPGQSDPINFDLK